MTVGETARLHTPSTAQRNPPKKPQNSENATCHGVFWLVLAGCLCVLPSRNNVVARYLSPDNNAPVFWPCSSKFACGETNWNAPYKGEDCVADDHGQRPN